MQSIPQSITIDALKNGLTLCRGVADAYPIFDAFVSSAKGSDLFGTLILQTFREMAADPRSMARRFTPSSFVVCETAKFRVLLKKIKALPENDDITSTASPSIVAVANQDGRLNVSVYSPPWQDISLFDPSLKLSEKDNLFLDSTTRPLIVDSEAIIDISSSNCSYAIILIENTFTTFTWHFDRGTLLARMIAATIPDIGRVQTAVEVIGELSKEYIERSLAASLLLEATSHRYHFVRWAAVRCLVKVDIKQGYNALNILKNDIHPHVAKSAVGALQMVSDQIRKEQDGIYD